MSCQNGIVSFDARVLDFRVKEDFSPQLKNNISVLSCSELDEVAGGFLPLAIVAVAAGGFVAGAAVGYGMCWLASHM